MTAHNLRLWLGLSAALMVVGTAGAQQDAASRDRSTLAIGEAVPLTLKPGATLRIRNVVGEIEVTRAAGPEATVTAIAQTATALPRIEMLRDEGESGMTICAVYDSRNPKKPNECLAGGKGRLTEGTNDKSAPVRFEIKLPDVVNFEGSQVKGNIMSRAGASTITLSTGVGDLSLWDYGSHSIDATIQLSGTLTAFISPGIGLERKIALEIATGKLHVAVPATAPISYTIASERPPVTTFTPERVGNKWRGRLGPPSPPGLTLVLTSGFMGAISLQQRR
jgi:hypothetical protein